VVVFIFGSIRQVVPAAFLKVLAPAASRPRTGGTLPGCTFAKHDPAFAQIVRRHFDMYAVSNDRTDAIATHFPCRIADDAMLIVEGDAEASIGQDLVDRAFHRNELFLRQSIILAYENSSARTYSGAEPMLVEMEVVPISRMRALFSNHNPSQTTLGNIYIAGRKKITIASIGGHQKCAVECAIRLQSTGQLQNDAGGSKYRFTASDFFCVACVHAG